MLARSSSFVPCFFAVAVFLVKAQCPTRNETIARHVGRFPCRKSCTPGDSRCKGTRVCTCDHECGYSCIKFENFCPLPPAIPNMENVFIYRGNTNPSLVPKTTNEFRYDDMAEYVCAPGYSKENTIPHFCHGRRGWTGTTNCVQICPNEQNIPTDVVTSVQCGTSCKTDDDCNESRRCFCDGLCGRTCVSEVTSCVVPSGLGASLITSPPDAATRAVGESMTYRCRGRERLLGGAEGEKSVTCLMDGRWSDQPPACVDLERSYIQAFDNINHVVYFLFDLAYDVDDTSLRNSVEFSLNLVRRFAENSTGGFSCGVIIFASRAKIILDPSGSQQTPDDVIELLKSIPKNRASTQPLLGMERYTSASLLLLKELMMLSSSQSASKNHGSYVLLFTNGKHGMGSPPGHEVVSISRSRDKPEFFLITSCTHCMESSDINEEFLMLAQDNPENIYFLDNHYEIDDVIDNITDARIDFSVCGQAGDIGSAREQTRLDRIIGGSDATERSWPWQGAITLYNENVIKTYADTNFFGGATLISNRFVLTAAHLFVTLSGAYDGWQQDVVVTLGLHKRPMHGGDRLPSVVKVFRARNVIEHELFTMERYDYDVALIELGDEIKQVGDVWETTSNEGWVTYTAFIRPVCLPCMGDSWLERVFTNFQPELPIGNLTQEECRIRGDILLERKPRKKKPLAVVTGFGHTSPLLVSHASEARPSLYLRQGLLKLETDERCRIVANDIIDWSVPPGKLYTERMLCAVSAFYYRTIDACIGDTGGPFVKEIYHEQTGKSFWMQIGLVSWGWGCGQEYRQDGILHQFPGYYTNVLRMMSWIKKRYS
ncbi:uncharacterized protein LOC143469513 [Clavelina lepadiformis]|uniref:uncharacterized protein LOC143469513 n=1 Tax=Clavelina lepadiformis TaxID=159417 RepID=UPI00404366ED